MTSRLKKYIDSRHRGIVPDINSIHKRVFCPLCQPQRDIMMQYNELNKSWKCPSCGHEAHQKLSQITLSKSELKASNDFYQIRQKVFFGSSIDQREHRRIAAFPLKNIYRQTNVYQSLAEAEQATNIHPEE